MHFLVLLTMLAVTTATYLVGLRVIPGAVRFLPELMSVIAVVYVVLAGIRTRFELVHARYWFLFGAAACVILCGIIANSVAPGPIIAGLRYYFRALPFFFLAAVYPFREWQILRQLKLLCAVALLQLPLAAYQKYDLLQHSRFTGDYVFGTLILSPTLSIFLISAESIILAFMMKGRLTKPVFSLLFLLFLIPTTINETKITVFVLPMVVIITVMVATRRGKRAQMFGVAIGLLAVAGSIFVPIYDYLGKQNVKDTDAVSVSDMFTKKDYFEKYLDQETKVGDSKAEVGRVDALTVPFSVITQDLVSAAFGYGIGNASISSLGSQFSGEYSATLGRYATSSPSAGAVLLEIGLLGALCALGLHWVIFRDSLEVARSGQSLIANIATAWPAVVILYTVIFFYTAPIPAESLSYLFWYISGLIAAERTRLARAEMPALSRAIKTSNTQLVTPYK